MKDKFLVMCTQLENDSLKSVDQLITLWKTIHPSKVQEQRSVSIHRSQEYASITG